MEAEIDQIANEKRWSKLKCPHSGNQLAVCGDAGTSLHLVEGFEYDPIVVTAV